MGQPHPQISTPSDLNAFLEHVLQRRLADGADYSASEDVSIAVSVQPVNEQLKPAGEPFVTVTKSVCFAGLVITHTRAVTDRLLRITLRARGCEVRTILDDVRCRCAGTHYDIRGDFHRGRNYETRADA